MQQRLPGHESPPPGVRGGHVSSPGRPVPRAALGRTLMICGDWLSCGSGAAAESEVHSEGLSLAFKRLRGTLKPDVQAVVGAP